MSPVRGKPRLVLPLLALIALGDLTMLHGSYLGAFWIRFLGQIPFYNLVAYVAIWPWLSLAGLGFHWLSGLYDVRRKTWSETFYSLIPTALATVVGAMALSFFLRGFSFPRTVLLIGLSLHLLLSLGWRYLCWVVLRRLAGREGVLIVGGDDGRALAGRISGKQPDVYELLGVIPPEVLEEFLHESEAIVDWAVICPSVGPGERAAVVFTCLAARIKVILVPGALDILMSTAKVVQLDDTPALWIGHGLGRHRAFKAVMDTVLGGLLLLFSLPLLALVGLAVKLDSPLAPVFYTQERLGFRGRPFRLYKFRTMVPDAERETGPVLAGENDPRVTRVGRLLRRTRLDELPQLVNVIKGDMSLVGPRPERPQFVERFVEEIPEYASRLWVKSGLTGLAQTAGNYDTSPEDKLRHDLLYIYSMNPWIDLRILYDTLKTVLMSEKAR